MDTLLDALQEGRLIELPDNNKDDALQFLAHILEAIPSIPTGTDVVGLVKAKETSANTALGKGWACLHARVPFEEDLMCVVGWSPAGIDYGAPDGIPVSIIVMYLVPANQRNHYLREVSILAKALGAYSEIERLRSVAELNDVRDYLLTLISTTKETVKSDTRARMIQLQARPSVEELSIPDLSALILEPLTLVTAPDMKPIVLAQNSSLVETLDGASELISGISSRGVLLHGGWQVIKRGSVTYHGDRVVYDCLAIKAAAGNHNGARPG
jgi:mannitol/fructose-specific phosphotransferase system IIA component (Ntr-type)